jgi:hypothetical protein
VIQKSLSALLVLCMWGCQSGQDPEPAAEPLSPVAGDNQPVVRMALVENEQRLLTAMDRAHFAFRSVDGGLRARHSTHEVSVAPSGGVRLVPINHTATGVVKGNALTLQTMDVRLGTRALGERLASTRIDASSGHLVIDRNDLQEELENFEGGVEQRWRFATRPSGDGSLTIRVDVAGHSFAGETKHGLHFQSNQLGFRYGHATWIDADGVATAIKSRWESDHIAITVPQDVLASSAYPAVLDPVIAPEQAVDSPVIGWTGTGSFRSAVATSGSELFVVWSDGRNGSQADIFGTRLSSTGAVLDNIGISVAEDVLVQDNPTVTFSNGLYVVAWDNGTGVAAATVTTGGTAASLGTVGNGSSPRLGSRGTDALLVFRDATGNAAGARFAGTFGAVFPITTGVSAHDPDVAGAPGGNYLVSWSEGDIAANLRGQFVTGAGALSGAAFDISAGAGGQNDSALAFNGTDYVAVWSNNSNGVDIFGTRVTTAGAILDTHLESTLPVGGKLINGAAGTQLQAAVACATGGNCLVAWSDRRTQATTANDVFGQRVDGALALVGGEIAVAAIGDEQRFPAIAALGTDWHVTWHDRRHGGPDTIFTTRVLADGSLPGGTGANIVGGFNRQIKPTIKASGNNWFAAWSDSRVLGNDVMGVRFSAKSVLLDSSARTVTAASGQQGSVASTFDGTDYVFVWNDTRNSGAEDIFAARMSVTGTVLDPSGIPVVTAAGDQQRPAIAFGGGVSLVVWQDSRAGFDIRGAILDISGNVTVADFPVCVAAGPQTTPAVVFDSTNNVFVVVFDDGQDVFATRVTTGGVSDGCGIAVSSATGNQTLASITFGNGEMFVAWQDSRTDIAGDIFGARLSAANSTLTVLDPNGIAIASGAAAQSEPSVAFIQPNLHVVVWGQDGNIFGQSVITNTGALDGGNFEISSNPESENRPVITAGPSGKPAMVVYEKVRPDLDTVRVVARRITFSGSSGTTCSQDSACVSGFCVDGVCCDSACGGNNTTDCQACSVSRGAQVTGQCSIILDTSHICRNYADTFCDRRELCDGVNITCPADVGRREGVACTLPGGVGTGVCPENDPPGPHVCQ